LQATPAAHVMATQSRAGSNRNSHTLADCKQQTLMGFKRNYGAHLLVVMVRLRCSAGSERRHSATMHPTNMPDLLCRLSVRQELSCALATAPEHSKTRAVPD
jgi:hypothetical protein